MERRLIECFVTHVENEGPLLKIWAQLDRKMPTNIEKAILQLAVQFENNINAITNPSALRVGELFCAKYSDGSYYRARITSLAKLAAGEVAVQFADYGNHEVIPLNNMRSLDGITNPLSSLPDQATSFYLAGVYPRTSDWSNELLGFIREAICYSDLAFLPSSDMSEGQLDVKFIQLMYEHQDFATILIAKNMGFAVMVDTQKQILRSMLEKMPLPSLTLWPPFNPSEPPPSSQMMVPSALANAAQLAVNESHQRRLLGIAQQAESQHNANQAFVGNAQRRIIQHSTIDSSFIPQMQFPQSLDQGYQSGSAQMRLEQARQLQQDHLNRNQIGIVPTRLPSQPPRPTYEHEAFISNASSRLQQEPIEHRFGTVLQPRGVDQQYSNPPPLQTLRPKTPVRFNNVTVADQAGYVQPREEVSQSLPHVFQSPVLEIGSEHVVFISYADDGPNGFAAQLSSLEEPLGKLLDDISRDTPTPLSQPLMPGSTCLGRYTLDKTLCRAVVMSVHAETCQVYYVDFGNSEELPYSEIFDMPQRYVIEPQVMAVRFTLSGLGNMAVTKQVKEIFSELVNNKQFLLRVVAPEGPPLRQYGILFDEGRSVLDILKEKLKTKQVSYTPVPVPEVGTTEMVVVAYVESLGKFFVQKHENINALDSVMEDLAIHCESAGLLDRSEIVDGLACCSLYSGDEMWYRAQVKNVTDEGIIVDYVDYGNTEPVQLDSLRKISPELVKAIQSQAITCSLNKLQNAEVGGDIFNKFTTLTDQKTLTMEVVGQLGDGLVVELHDKMGPMPVNIGAALRAPKQAHQAIQEHPAPAKIVNPPLPVAKNERRDLQEAAVSNSSYGEPSRDSHTEEKPYQRGGSRSNAEDWRQKNDPQEERPARGDRYDNSRSKERGDTGRYGGDIDKDVNHFGGNKEERKGNQYGGREPAPGGDRYEKKGNRYGDNNGEAEEKGNRFGGGREERQTNRFGSDKEEKPRYGSDKDENRFGANKEERSRYGGDRDDKGGNRYGGDREDKGGNRYGGDREDKGGNRYGGNKDSHSYGGNGDDKGSNRYGSDRKERAPRERGDWGSEDKKQDSFGGLAESNPIVETVQVFATADEMFANSTVTPDLSESVEVIWFTNPENFFVQITSGKYKLEQTMNDIQTAYCGKEANVKYLEVGSPVIAKYQMDRVLYRAEITEVKGSSYVVRYVDYGNCDMVNKSNMWQIESRFLTLPKQAVLCTLTGITPVQTEWPTSQNDIDKLFQDSTYQCTFHENVDEKYHVTLMHNDVNVADELIAIGAARSDSATSEIPSIEVPIASQCYLGQTLLCHVTYVEGVAKFFGHFDVDEANRVQALVDEHVQDPKNVVPLSVDEVCVDQLCIATADSAQWYRAKIIESTETDGTYYVTFIDYGDGDEVAVDKMIALPDWLSPTAHAAQATEMFLVGSDVTEVEPETEDLFKANLESVDIIVHVDCVIEERLNVSVFSSDGQKLELVKNIGDTSLQVEPVLPLPILTQKVKVFVSHLDGPSSVWLQKAKDSEALTKLLDSMYAFYEEGALGVDLTPEVNALCAAKSTIDEGWYRARVVAITEEGIQVLFIDYGNGEVVPIENVKVLDSSLHTPHALAFNATLPVIVKAEVESDVLTEMTTEVEYTAVFHRDDEGRWLSELINKKETLTDRLVEQGCVEMMSEYPFTQFVEELTKMPKLVTGMLVSVYVSHIDSPDAVYIQLEELSAEIENLQTELQDAVESFEVLTDPECNTMCVAQYSDDGVWYRATILQVNGPTVVVRFVDYGNTDQVDITANPLKKLSTKFAKIDKYAIQCKLNVLPLETEFSEEANEGLKALVAGTAEALLAKVLREADITVIDILSGDKSFTASLIDDNFVMEFAEESSAFVSHVNSPSEFWIQTERSAKHLEIMADSLLEAESFEPFPEVVEGNLCAAQFVDDEQWYRAKVIAATEDGTEVHFIDYGNAATSSELRTLPENLAAMLPLAKCCLLPLPENATKWSEESVAAFVELVAEGATSFTVEILTDGNPAVVNLVHNGKNVADVLVNTEPIEEGAAAADLVDSLPETNLDNMDSVEPAESMSEDYPEKDLIDESEPITCTLEETDVEKPVEVGDEVASALPKSQSVEMEGEVASLLSEGQNVETIESIQDHVDVESPSDLHNALEAPSENSVKNDDTTDSTVVNAELEQVNEDVETIESSGSLGSTNLVLDEVANESSLVEDMTAVGDGDGSKSLVENKVDGHSKSSLPDVVCPATPDRCESSSPFSGEAMTLLKSSARPNTPRNNTEKIVPGSVRGVSEEELNTILFCPINPQLEHSENDVPEAEDSFRSLSPEAAQSCPATPIPIVDRPIQRTSSLEIQRPSPRKLTHGERIVPGCVSRGESLEKVDMPLEDDSLNMSNETTEGKTVNETTEDKTVNETTEGKTVDTGSVA